MSEPVDMAAAFEQLRRKRLQLERDIETLVEGFERATGTRVDRIGVGRDSLDFESGERMFESANITVKLRTGE